MLILIDPLLVDKTAKDSLNRSDTSKAKFINFNEY